MLTSLHIQNYALIDTLDINFDRGLSIITGETGAGKSILLGALGLLLGKRADSTVLKDGAKKCVVESEFNIKEYKLEHFFEENDIDYDELAIIRREISNKGKSRAFINDVPVTLNTLQRLTLSLVDIHSQHENLLLNNERYLLGIIDIYSGSGDVKSKYTEAYLEYQSAKNEYRKAKESIDEEEKELEYTEHRFQELDAANLKEGELESLEQELANLSHIGEIKTAFQEMLGSLSEEEMGALVKIREAEKALDKIKEFNKQFETLGERLRSANIELTDIVNESLGHFEQAEFDPERNEYFNNRLSLLYDLLQKFKANTVVELINIRNHLDERLQNFAIGDIQLKKLQDKLKDSQEKMESYASELSKKRSCVFEKFEEEVSMLLSHMGMPKSKFIIENENVAPSEEGIDKIRFLFTPNVGYEAKNISKIASGGELSRLMLAIKSLVSGSAGLPTIIFDEIDAGVSGEIADKMGNIIKEMSSNMQVINITHLPQIAAKGDKHYVVYKENDHGTMKTSMRLLDRNGRKTEIAKMLSGEKISEAAMNNADELLGY